jgi:GNAT superfamily N-acetyltransferase
VTRERGAPEYAPLTVAFAAAVDGRPVGDLLATLLWGRLTVNLLEVEKSERGRKIGTKLMQAAEDFARAHGAVGVDLDTPAWQGEGFYETLGYEELGRLRLGTAGHFDGAPKDKIIYHKEF